MKKLLLIPLLLFCVTAFGQWTKPQLYTNINTNIRLKTYSPTRMAALLDSLVATMNISGGGGTWGSITGTLSSQTDLQTALDDKFSLTNGGTLLGASVLLDGDGNTFTINNIDVFTLGATVSLDFDAPAFTFSNGPVSFEAGTTGYSSLKIPHGVAPTSPVDGDLWSTTGGFYGRVNGTTYPFINTFSNGLTESGGTVKLMGLLTDDTDISADGTKYFRIGDSGTNQGVLDFRVFAKDYVNIRAGEFSSGNYNGLQIVPSGVTSGTVIESFDSDSNTTEAVIGSGTGQYYGFTVRTGNPTASTRLQIRPDGLWQVNLGSDATGDTYYRNSSGYFTRLPVGTNGHVLTLAAGVPSWAAPASGWALTGTSTLTGAVDIVGSSSNTIKHTFPSLGTTQTDGAGLWFTNTTAAAAGAQQRSPSIVQEGQGWKTNATAASQSVKVMTDVLPVQGAANPTASYRWAYSVNGAAYTSFMSWAQVGDQLTVPSTLFYNGNLILRSGSTSGTLIGNGTSGVPINALTLSHTSTSTNTSGTHSMLLIGNTGSFAPTSGTAIFNGIRWDNTINQTGGANGQITGFNSIPTITAAVDVTGFIHQPTNPNNISGKNLSFVGATGTALFGNTTYASSTNRVEIKGVGTSTGKGLLIEDSGGTDRFAVEDDGSTFLYTAPATGEDHSNFIVRDGSTGELKTRRVHQTIPISSAEILALNGTPKTLIAAPGSGYIIQVESITIIFTYLTAPYATNTDLEIDLAGVDLGYSLTNILNQSNNNTRYGLPPPNIQTTTDLSNGALTMKVKTGNPTAGSGTLNVLVSYNIIGL